MISIIFRTSTWKKSLPETARPRRRRRDHMSMSVHTSRSAQARLPQLYQGRPQRNEPAALGGFSGESLRRPRRRHAPRDGVGRTSWSSEALAVPERADSAQEAPRRAEGAVVDGFTSYVCFTRSKGLSGFTVFM